MPLEKTHYQLQINPENGATKHKQRERNGSFFNATEMMNQAKKQIQKIILISGVFFMFISSVCCPAWGLEILQDFLFSLLHKAAEEIDLSLKVP